MILEPLVNNSLQIELQNKELEKKVSEYEKERTLLNEQKLQLESKIKTLNAQIDDCYKNSVDIKNEIVYNLLSLVNNISIKLCVP